MIETMRQDHMGDRNPLIGSSKPLSSRVQGWAIAKRLELWCGVTIGLLFSSWLVTDITRSTALAQSMPSDRPLTNQPMPVQRPILQLGSQGRDVSQLQAILTLLGYYTHEIDGIYQESTAIAVASFQQSIGLVPDGIMGPETWNRLLPSPELARRSEPPEPTPINQTQNPQEPREETGAAAEDLPQETSPEEPANGSATFPTPTAIPTEADPELPESSNATPSFPQPDLDTVNEGDTPEPPTSQDAVTDPSPDAPDNADSNPNPEVDDPEVDDPEVDDLPDNARLPVLRRGMRGEAVTRLQTRLQALGFFDGTVDGVFGAETEASVLAAQEFYDLVVDGIVGPATWEVLLP